MRPDEMIKDTSKQALLWLEQATLLCADVQNAKNGEELPIAKAVLDSLNQLSQIAETPIVFRPNLEISADKANEVLSVAVICAVRAQASYMISRNITGEAIATIVNQDYCGEATFVGQSEALALIGALLQAQIQAKAMEIGLDLNQP